MRVNKASEISSDKTIWNFISCDICSNERFIRVLDTDYFDTQLSTMLCISCGLLQTNPRASVENYNRFYETDYRNLYFSCYRRAKLKEPRAIDIQIAKIRFDQYEMWISKSQTIEEFGAGSGDFAHEVIKNYNLVTYRASDPDHLVISQAKRWWDLDISWGVIPSHINAIESINDLIVVFHVLEHVYDLEDSLRSFNKMLKLDGHLIIEVPDIASDWEGLSMFHPAHLRHFNIETLSLALSLNHFEVVYTREHQSGPLINTISVVARKVDKRVERKAQILDIEKIVQEIKTKIRSEKFARSKKCIKRPIRYILKRFVEFKNRSKSSELIV